MKLVQLAACMALGRGAAGGKQSCCVWSGCLQERGALVQRVPAAPLASREQDSRLPNAQLPGPEDITNGTFGACLGVTPRLSRSWGISFS